MMARTTSSNYSTPSFPKASTDLDPFDAFDVQQLAAAVDSHDHSSGKGLITSIPNGTITSAMIADGTIVAADLATNSVITTKLIANAVTLATSVNGSTANPTTTSTAMVDMPDMSVTLVATGGDLLMWLTCVVSASVALTAGMQLNVDGVDVGPPVGTYIPSASAQTTISLAYRLGGQSAGSRVIKGRWSTTTGTITAVWTYRSLIALEIRR